MTTVLRKNLILEKCDESNPNYTANDKHPNGCYIRFNNNKISHSKPIKDCIADYDENGDLVGLEFYEGL